MSNRLDIVNGVLRLLGNAPENSLRSDNELLKSINYSVDSSVDMLLLMYDWTFAIKFITFSTPNSTNISPEYKYTFELPYDFLRIHKFMCGCSMPHPCCFEIINNVILSNQCPIKFYYIVNKIKNFDLLPTYFCRLVSFFIAQDIALSYTKNLTLQQYLTVRYKEELNLAINYNNVNRPFAKRAEYRGGYDGCC